MRAVAYCKYGPVLPVSATMRSRSNTYSLSCATDRSAYLMVPMPTMGAMEARVFASRSGRASSMTARAVETASSSSARAVGVLPIES